MNLSRNIIAAALIGATAVFADDEKESDRCVLCHEQATKDWLASPHAQTMNDAFLNEWTKEGKKWECLVCHTSRSDRKTGAFSHDGISCESCHGAMKEDHPDKSRMVLPATSEICQSCHGITYGEWRVSLHGQKNIRCFDCHKMHEMKPRKDDPDQMCGTCHTERLKDYSHATHHLKGVKCINCHMPEVMGAGLKIKGTGARGHTYTVGAETCANCHKEMVHTRSDIAALEGEVQRLKEITPDALQKQVVDQQKDIEELRTAVQANRRVFSVIVVVAFFLGVAIEYAIMHHLHRKWTKS